MWDGAVELRGRVRRSDDDTSVDPFNCGACGVTCTGGKVCSGGVCQCPLSQLACGGVCIDLQNDRLNCGSCGKTCTAGFGCSVGACGCALSETQCGSSCVNLQIDPKNCGACGKACGLAQVCVGAKCTP